MILNEINLLFCLFIFIFFNLLLNSNTSLHLLIIAEILWISLYSVSLLLGYYFDNLNTLSLSFFFLIFSAIELGIGLVLILCQNIFQRSIFLTDNDVNYPNFFNKTSLHLNLNKLKWKF